MQYYSIDYSLQSSEYRRNLIVSIQIFVNYDEFDAQMMILWSVSVSDVVLSIQLYCQLLCCMQYYYADWSLKLGDSRQNLSVSLQIFDDYDEFDA